MSLLETTDIFEERSTLWRELARFNAEQFPGVDVDKLSDQQVDDLLKNNAAVVKTPQKLLKWKYPLKDKLADGSYHHYYVVSSMTPPGYILTPEEKAWSEANDKRTYELIHGPATTVARG